MSNTVDQRVVQMDFDNAKFERGVRTTLESLTRLKDKIDNTTGKNLSKMTDTPVEFRGIEAGIEKLNQKFSTMGQIWSTVVSRATNAAINKFGGAIQQIKSGGAQRAANIDQATFMLKGLIGNGKKADKMLEKVKKNAMDAVDGTAYGFDSAAKAAAQFYASGMKGGKKMEGALRGVAGVAAMTGSSYDDIARIFTTVAGQGKVTAEQWNQLASRGINGAAAMAKQMGITEKKVREMTSKGEISFKMFAKAMDNAFGEHAKKANETFEGSLANMKAALSRVGAEFFTPYRAHMIRVFNSITPLINSLKKALSPVALTFDKMFGALTKFASRNLQSLNVGFESFGKKMQVVTEFFNKKNFMSSYFKDLIAGFRNILDAVKPFGNAIKDAFNKVFNVGEKIHKYFDVPIDNSAKALKKLKKVLKKDGITGLSKDELTGGMKIAAVLGDLINKFKEFTSTLKANDRIVNNFRDTFGGLFAVLHIVWGIISAVISALIPGRKAMSGFVDALLAITGTIGRALMSLDKFLTSIGFFKTVGNVVRAGVNIIASAIGNLFHIFANLTTIISNFVHKHMDSVITAFSVLSGKLKFGMLVGLRTAQSAFKSLGESLKQAFSGGLINNIKKFGNTVKWAAIRWNVLFTLHHGGRTIFDVIREKLDGTKIGHKILEFAHNVKWAAIQWNVIFAIHHGGRTIFDIIKNKIEDIKSIGVVQTLKDIGHHLKWMAIQWGVLFALKNSGKTVFEIIAEKAKKAKDVLDDFTGGAITKFISKMSSIASSVKSGILDKISTFKQEGFSGLINSLKSLTLSDVAHGLGTAAHTIAQALITLKNALVEFYSNNVADKIEPFKKKLAELFKALGNAIKNFKLKDFDKVADAIKKLFDGLKQSIGRGNEHTAAMLDKMGNALSTFFHALASGDAKQALKGIASAFIIFENFKELKKKSKESKTAVGSFKHLMDSLSSTITSFKKTQMTRSSAFKEIAKGILMLAGSLYIIASIDTGKLKVAVGVLAGVAIAIGILVKVLESDGMKLHKDMGKFAAALSMADEYKKLVDVSAKLQAIGDLILKLAASLLIISFAFVKMGDTKNMAASIGGVVAVIGSLGLLIAAITMLAAKNPDVNPDIFQNIGKAMVGIAAACVSMAKAMDIIGKIDPSRVGQAIVGIVAIMAMMTVFSTFVSNSAGTGSVFKAAAGMLVLAAAVAVMAVAANLMSNASVGGIVAGVVALIALYEVTKLLSGLNEKLNAVGGYIVSIAKALLLVALSALVMTQVDWAALGKTAVALVGLLAILSGFSILATKFPQITAGLAGVTAAIVLVSASLLILAVALRLLVGIKFSEVASGILSLAALLGVLTVACIGLTAGIVGAVALLAVSVAIGILAVALGLIAAIPSATIVSNFESITMALAKFVAIMGAVGWVAGPGLALIGVGLALAGLGVMAFAAGLTHLIQLIPQLVALLAAGMLDTALQGISKIFGTLAKGAAVLGVGLLAFAVGAALAGAAAILLAAGLRKVGIALLVVAAGIAALAISIALLAVAVMLFAAAITGSGQQIIATVRNIAATILGVVVSLISNLLAKIPVVGDKLSEAFSSWGDGLKDKLAGEKTQQTGKQVPEEIAKGMDSNKDKVTNAMDGLIGDEASSKLKSKAEKTGKETSDGLTSSLTEGLSSFSGDFDLEKLTGNLPEKASKEGEESGKALDTSFLDSLGENGGDFDIEKLTGDLVGKSEKQGKEGGSATAKGYKSTLKNAKVDASSLPKSAAKSIKKDKSFKNAAKENVKDYKSGFKGAKVDASTLPKSASKSIKKDPSIKNAAKSNVKDYNQIINKADGSEKAGKSLGKKAANGAGSTKSAFHSAGGDAVQGYINGVAAKEHEAYQAGYKVGAAAVRGTKDGQKSSSPSKLMKQLGVYAVQGFVIGIENYTNKAYNAAYDMASGVVDATKGALQYISEASADDFDFDPTIRPVVDMSNVENAALNANTMLANGLNVPVRGLNIAGNLATTITTEGMRSSKMASSFTRLANKLEGATEAMNNRELNMYVTVNGSENPEDFADRLISRMKLQMRTG